MIHQVKKITEAESSHHSYQAQESAVSHVFALSKLLIDIQRDVKNKSIANASVQTALLHPSQ